MNVNGNMPLIQLQEATEGHPTINQGPSLEVLRRYPPKVYENTL